MFDYQEEMDQYLEEIEELARSKQYTELRELFLPMSGVLLVRQGIASDFHTGKAILRVWMEIGRASCRERV